MLKTDPSGYANARGRGGLDAPRAERTNPNRIRSIAWIIGTGFAAIAGLLIAPSINLSPEILTLLVVQAYAAAALGLFKNIGWTFAGGLLVGVLSSLGTYWGTSSAIISDIAPGVPFALLLIVLFVVPKGRLPRPRLVAQPGRKRPSWRVHTTDRGPSRYRTPVGPAVRRESAHRVRRCDRDRDPVPGPWPARAGVRAGFACSCELRGHRRSRPGPPGRARGPLGSCANHRRPDRGALRCAACHPRHQARRPVSRAGNLRFRLGPPGDVLFEEHHARPRVGWHHRRFAQRWHSRQQRRLLPVPRHRRGYLRIGHPAVDRSAGPLPECLRPVAAGAAHLRLEHDGASGQHLLPLGVYRRHRRRAVRNHPGRRDRCRPSTRSHHSST